MEKKILLIVIVIIGLIAGNSYAQSVGDFGAVKNGSWNDPTVWKLWNGSSFSTPTTLPPRAGDDAYTNGFSIKITADAAVDNLQLEDLKDAIVVQPGMILTVNGVLDGLKKIKKDAIGGTGTIRFTGSALSSSSSSVIGKNITSKVTFGSVLFAPGTGNQLLATKESMEFEGDLTVVSGTVEFGPKADLYGINHASFIVAKDAKAIVYGAISSSKSAKSTIEEVAIAGVLEVYGNVNTTSLMLDSSGVFNTAYKGAKGWWKDKADPETVALLGTVIFSGANQGVPGYVYNNLFLAGKGTKKLVGDVLVNGILSMRGTTDLALQGETVAFGPKGTLEYAGEKEQLTGGEFPDVDGPLNLWIKNANGVVLAFARTVAGEFMLQSGNLTTTMTNLLTLGPVSKITGGSAASFVDGPLGQSLSTANSEQRAYPIGKDAEFQPINLRIAQTSATLTTYIAEAILGAPPARLFPATLDRVSPHNYWQLSKSGAGSIQNGQIVIYYSAGEGVTDPANLRVAKDNGAGMWEDLGGVGTGTPNGSITSTNNFTKLGDFVLANAKGGGNFGALPVSLVSFDAMLNSGAVILTWTTASEINNAGFEIERSANGTAWEKIGYVAGQGNSAVLNAYTFTDVTIGALTSPVAYYRLRQVDLNGSYAYSSVEAVQISSKGYNTFAIEKIYPNPSKEELNININVPAASQVRIDVTDYTGKVILSETHELSDGSSLVRYNAIDWPKGIYIVRASTINEHVAIKWMKD